VALTVTDPSVISYTPLIVFRATLSVFPIAPPFQKFYENSFFHRRLIVFDFLAFPAVNILHQNVNTHSLQHTVRRGDITKLLLHAPLLRRTRSLPTHPST
jgi:hypothetical protein